MSGNTFEVAMPDNIDLSGMVPDPPLLDAWRAARLGMITGSNFHRITRSRGGKRWSETATSYMYDIIMEHVTGQVASDFTGSRATEWGNEYEEAAIREFTQRYGHEVKRGEFYRAPGFSLVGCTPDGLGDKIGLEVKCPLSFKNHFRTVETRQVPKEYVDQVSGHMLCTGRRKCAFVSYDPRIERPDLRMVIVEVQWDEMQIGELRARLQDFEAEVLGRLEKHGIERRN